MVLKVVQKIPNEHKGIYCVLLAEDGFLVKTYTSAILDTLEGFGYIHKSDYRYSISDKGSKELDEYKIWIKNKVEFLLQ
jgi:hypothetical protein